MLLGVVDAKALVASPGHHSTLVALDLALSSPLGLEDPCRWDGLCTRGQIDDLPSPISHQSEHFLSSSSFPMLGIRSRHSLLVGARITGSSTSSTSKVIDFTIATQIVITVILNGRGRLPRLPERWSDRCRWRSRQGMSWSRRCDWCFRGWSRRGRRSRGWCRSRWGRRGAFWHRSRCRRARGRFRDLPPLPWLL